MTDSNDGQGGFLSRWSQRKAQVKQPQSAPSVPAVPAEPAVHTEPALRQAQRERDPVVAVEPAEAPARPTLEDVAELTRESDFSRFVAPGVDTGVKNAAMKKLFTDPHFNVMDGLDIYIDDYNKFEPIPKSMLRQLVQARALGLLDDELEEQDKPTPDNPALHEDPDLQLQPDDAAGQPGAGPGLAESREPGEPGDDGGQPGSPAHDVVPPRSP
ncbi:MAG: DUF3306 domain-containing protein [Burkholderiaceae bacterium]